MLRKVATYTWVAVGIAALYVGFVFLSRSDQNQRLARQKAQDEAEAARKAEEPLGGGRLKIVNFYALPDVLRKGQKGKLCYSVANAVSVAIEPAVDRVWPALGRCMDIAPAHDTEYTFTARDAEGHIATEKVSVRVE